MSPPRRAKNIPTSQTRSDGIFKTRIHCFQELFCGVQLQRLFFGEIIIVPITSIRKRGIARTRSRSLQPCISNNTLNGFVNKIGPSGTPADTIATREKKLTLAECQRYEK